MSFAALAISAVPSGLALSTTIISYGSPIPLSASATVLMARSIVDASRYAGITALIAVEEFRLALPCSC